MTKIISLSVLLFTFFISSAQVDRRIGAMPPPTSNKQEKVDPIKLSLDFLKKELQLDTFQEAALKTLLEDNQKEKEFILGLDISDESKTEKLQTSFDKMDDKLIKLLSPDQVERLKKIKEKRNKSKDKKSIKKEKSDN
jgi:hypothetical protein